jgi:hypothetical protein
MLSWDVYEITSEENSLTGVKLRGTLRKFAIENQIDLIPENAEDQPNTVRYSILANASNKIILSFISNLIPDATVIKVLTCVQNPVSSKLKINDKSRY